MVQQEQAATSRRATSWGWMGSALRGLVERAEPIQLTEQRFNFLPQRFRWRGQQWRVRQIVRVWDQRHRSGCAPRRYYRVVCHGGGDYVLFQDLRVGTWHLSV